MLWIKRWEEWDSGARDGENKTTRRGKRDRRWYIGGKRQQIKWRQLEKWGCVKWDGDWDIKRKEQNKDLGRRLKGKMRQGGARYTGGNGESRSRGEKRH